MTITAKFNSTCPVCRGQILAGDPVEWEPGEKAVHVACVDNIRYRLEDGRVVTAEEFAKEIYSEFEGMLPHADLVAYAKEVLTNHVDAGKVKRVYGPAPSTATTTSEEPIRTTIVKLRRWLAEEKGCPVLMKGEVLRETAKAIYFRGEGHINEVNCFICGRELTNKWSIRMGVGPVCADKTGFDASFEVEDLTDEEVREIRARHFQMGFEGWLPKSKIEELGE